MRSYNTRLSLTTMSRTRTCSQQHQGVDYPSAEVTLAILIEAFANVERLGEKRQRDAVTILATEGLRALCWAIQQRRSIQQPSSLTKPLRNLTSSILSLPLELVCRICTFLPLRARFNLTQASAAFRALIEHASWDSRHLDDNSRALRSGQTSIILATALQSTQPRLRMALGGRTSAAALNASLLMCAHVLVGLTITTTEYFFHGDDRDYIPIVQARAHANTLRHLRVNITHFTGTLVDPHVRLSNLVSAELVGNFDITFLAAARSLTRLTLLARDAQYPVTELVHVLKACRSLQCLRLAVPSGVSAVDVAERTSIPGPRILSIASTNAHWERPHWADRPSLQCLNLITQLAQLFDLSTTSHASIHSPGLQSMDVTMGYTTIREWCAPRPESAADEWMVLDLQSDHVSRRWPRTTFTSIKPAILANLRTLVRLRLSFRQWLLLDYAADGASPMVLPSLKELEVAHVRQASAAERATPRLQKIVPRLESLTCSTSLTYNQLLNALQLYDNPDAKITIRQPSAGRLYTACNHHWQADLAALRVTFPSGTTVQYVSCAVPFCS